MYGIEVVTPGLCHGERNRPCHWARNATRAFALWWLHGEYLAEPEVHGTYMLKISEIKKKMAPKQ